MNYQTDYERMRANREMKLFIMWICVALGILAGVAALEASAWDDPLQKAIKSLVSVAPNHRLNGENKAAAFSNDVYLVSGMYNVPESLILTVSYLEASLNPSAIGSRGEIGLMQVHGLAARDCDLKTERGQLDCGAHWLDQCRDKCGTWDRALTAYAVGTCKTASKHVQKKIKYRMRFWEKVKRLMK